MKALNLAEESRKLFLLLFSVSALAGMVAAPALGQVTSTWTGGSGEWAPCPNEGGNALWDTCGANPAQYPDGNYNAVIQGGAVVTLSAQDGNAIDNVSISPGSNLILQGGYVDITANSIANNGTITIVSGNGLGLIGQGATVTLSGGGTVKLTSSESNIHGTSGSSPIFINQQTIAGQGAIGIEGFSIQNQSTINASGGLLTVQPSSGGIVNTGLMEASSGATLDIVYGSSAPFNNTGGTIQALNGGIVQLQGPITTGGTLTTTGNGVIQLSGDAVLNSLINNGTVQVPDNTALLQNTITNNGSIQVLSGTLFMEGTVTLKGSGSLLLGNSSSNLEQNTTSVGTPGGSLINQQLVHGGGTFYDLPLTNQATIEADNATVPLYVDTATTNTATMEASGGAELVISPGIAVNNTGGTIEALSGSTVLLEGTIAGGTLKNTGTGVLESEDATLDGTVNVPTIAGILKIPAGYNTSLQGTINNTGTIEFSGNGCLLLNEPTTLMGAGKVILGTSNCVSGSGNTFTNNSTIEGTGSIGDSNEMPIVNNGTFLANKSTSLTISPNSGGFTNNGKLTVSKGSTMIINSIFGPFNNLAGGTLTGGTYTVTGQLDIADGITTNDASITLIGSSGEIVNTSAGGNALTALVANAIKGSLTLQSGQVLTTGASFSNAGKITVGAGSGFTVGGGGTFTQTAGTTIVDGTLTASTGLDVQKGTLEGKGTLVGAVTSAGTLIVGDAVTKAGLLTINGAYTQSATGVLDVAVGGTTVGSQYGQLAVSNGVSLGGTLTLKLINGFVPELGETFTIVTGSAVTGQFTTVKGTSINSGEHFEVSYGARAVTLTVVSGA
jgi:fibronectin-binding autotransporter adhesin